MSTLGSKINTALIGLTGHRVRDGESPNDVTYHGLPLIGAAVAFAAMIAAINMGLLGYVLADGASMLLRICLVVALALIGMAMVLIVDRAAIQLGDTVNGSRNGVRWIYVVVRSALVMLVSSLTSQAITPLLLRSELIAHALHMREASDSARSRSLAERFELNQKRATANDAATRLQTAQVAVAKLPIDIQARLGAAKGCWSQYSAELRALQNTGTAHGDAKLRLVSRAARCTELQHAAATARDEYLKQARAELTNATAAHAEATGQLREAHSEVGARTRAAAETESDAYTYRSATVMHSLLQESPGARLKWFIVTALQLALEFLPMLLKVMNGQSVAGRRIMDERECAIGQYDDRRRAAEGERINHETMTSISADAAEGLRHSAAAQQAIEQTHLALLHANAPIETMNKLMHWIRERQAEVDRFISKYPQHASTVSEAWNRVIEQATAAMVRHMYARTAN